MANILFNFQITDYLYLNKNKTHKFHIMKQTIRLNESELKHLIRESVKRVLREAVNDKLQFIIDIVRDCGDVQLDDSCGKYYALTDNGQSIMALSFVGRGGYNATPIEKLKPQVIDAIYNDLYQDFGEPDSEEECLDKNGKPIKVDSKVIWYDPERSARDLKRVWTVWQISGDIVYITDDNGGEAEVFPNELKVVG